MTKCCICGKVKNEAPMTDSSGKPYRLQFCGCVNCTMEAWRRIREAAKTLPRPKKKPEIARVDEPAPKPKYNGLSDEKIERIRELHKQGLTQKEIANVVGVSPVTVSKYVRGI